MKIRRLDAFWGIILVLTILSIAPVLGIVALSEKNLNASSDTATGAICFGQNFTIGASSNNQPQNLTNILFKVDNAGSAAVSCNYSLWSADFGDNLVSNTTNCGEFLVGIVNISMPRYRLNASRTYGFTVCKTAISDYKLDERPTNAYSGGTRIFSNNPEAGVTIDPSSPDLWFEIYSNYSLYTVINSPANKTAYAGASVNVTLNCTGYSNSLANVSLFIGGIRNYTVTAVSDSKELAVTYAFPISNYSWYCESRDTANAQSSSETNVFNITSVVINSQTFNTPVHELSSQTFSLNISYDYEHFSIIGKLIYEGVSYDGVVIGSGNNVLINRTIQVSSVSSTTNKSFYWTLNATSGATSYYFNYTLTNQTVSPIFLSICNVTYTTPTINFTLYDELTGSILPLSSNVTFLVTFRFNSGSGLLQKSYSYSAINVTNNSFVFCLSPNGTLKADVDLQYTALGYADKTYYMRNYSLSNVTTIIPLLSLSSLEATKFFVSVKESTNFLVGAIINVSKYFVGEGIYKTVLIGLTDDKGQFVANLDLDQTYHFEIVKDGFGYGVIEKLGSCQASPCTIDLQTDEAPLSAFGDFYDYFAQNVVYNLTYYPNSSIVVLNFTDNLGTAQYWRLWVYKANYGNDTLITICDTKTYSVSGSITCDYTGQYGNIQAKVFISRSPEKLVDFINFVNENAPSILGATGILASIIILLVILFTATRNPAIAIIMIPFSLAILKFIGFVPIDWSWIGALTIFCLWIAKKLNT